MKRLLMILTLSLLMFTLSCDDYMEDLSLQTGLNDGLLAYWPVVESSGNLVYDYSGNSNDLTITNASYNVGVYSKSINCTAATVIEASQSNYFFQGNQFSVAMWIKAGNNTPENLLDTNLNAVTIEQNGSTISVFLVDPDDASHLVLTADNSINIGEWVYLTLTYDGDNVKLYINADLRKVAIYSYGVTKAADDINIANGSWVGNLDEIRIYNRALSKEEIEALMDIGVD